MALRVRQPCLERFLVSLSKGKLDAKQHNDSIRNVLFITSVCDKARRRLRNGCRSRSLEDLDTEGRFMRTKRPSIKRPPPIAQDCRSSKLGALADVSNNDDTERPHKRVRMLNNDDDRTVPDERECDGDSNASSDSSTETDSDSTMDDDSEHSTSSDEEMELSAVLSGLIAADENVNLQSVSAN